MSSGEFTEARGNEMVAGVASYMRSERALYVPHSEALAEEWATKIRPYFPANVVDQLRTVTLKGARIPPPPFYADAVAMSGGRFPDFVHMASFTYIDVIVFHERIEARTLFHAAVHAAQMEILGFERYVDLYVRSFVKNRSWLAIPLEDQAYKLDARFAKAPTETFSVEDEVKLWQAEGRYS